MAGIHYQPDSYVAIGERFAEALAQIGEANSQRESSTNTPLNESP